MGTITLLFRIARTRVVIPLPNIAVKMTVTSRAEDCINCAWSQNERPAARYYCRRHGGILGVLVFVLVFSTLSPAANATVDISSIVEPITGLIDSKMSAVSSLATVPGTLIQTKADMLTGIGSSVGDMTSGISDAISGITGTLGDMVQIPTDLIGSLMGVPQQLIQAKMDALSGITGSFSMSETRDRASMMQAETFLGEPSGRTKNVDGKKSGKNNRRVSDTAKPETAKPTDVSPESAISLPRKTKRSLDVKKSENTSSKIGESGGQEKQVKNGKTRKNVDIDDDKAHEAKKNKRQQGTENNSNAKKKAVRSNAAQAKNKRKPSDKVQYIAGRKMLGAM